MLILHSNLHTVLTCLQLKPLIGGYYSQINHLLGTWDQQRCMRQTNVNHRPLGRLLLMHLYPTLGRAAFNLQNERGFGRVDVHANRSEQGHRASDTVTGKIQVFLGRNQPCKVGVIRKERDACLCPFRRRDCR